MQTKLRSITFLVILGVISSACGPQGRVPRTIHPPLPLHKTPEAEGTKATSSFQRTRSGLPANCRRETNERDHFCIRCDGGGIDLERCYAFRGTFDEASSCVYTSESIKCLHTRPPFALNIALKGSLEKTLIDHTRLWEESLRAIARPRLTVTQQGELDRSLDRTGQLVRQLVRCHKPATWMEQEFSEIFQKLRPDEQKRLKKSLEDLQTSKEAGHLKLLQVLQASRSLLEAAGTSAALLPFWEALSVEGLEDPGE